MGKRQDLRQDEYGDIYINPTTGDFEIIESDSQHVNDILQAVSGDYKEFPLVGVNFYLYHNSTGQRERVEQTIRTQLQGDGYQVTKVTIPESFDSLQDISVQANAPNI